MSRRSTAIASSSHTGGFAGMAWPPVEQGQRALLRNPKHGPTAPGRAFPLPKALPVQGDVPTSKGSTGRRCSHPLLGNTRKHFWRPQGIALFFWAGKGPAEAVRSMQAGKCCASLLLTALIQGGNSWPLYLPHKACQLLFLFSNKGWRRLHRHMYELSMLLMIMLQEVISQLLVAAMKSTKQARPRSAEQLVFLVVLGTFGHKRNFTG